MIRAVVRLPDPVLTARAAPVEAVDAAVRALVDDLIDTMRASPACVGLAAPQIGVGLRVFVADVTGHRNAATCHGLVALCNPELVHAGAAAVAREGCMSVPDLTGDVARSGNVVVRGLDVDGRPRVIETDAFEARALLHELDHLDGLLFLDRVASGRAVFPRKTYR